MEFPRQEYWSGLPFSPPGDLPDTGIEPASLASPASTESPGTPVPDSTSCQTQLTVYCLCNLYFGNPGRSPSSFPLNAPGTGLCYLHAISHLLFLYCNYFDLCKFLADKISSYIISLFLVVNPEHFGRTVGIAVRDAYWKFVSDRCDKLTINSVTY